MPYTLTLLLDGTGRRRLHRDLDGTLALNADLRDMDAEGKKSGCGSNLWDR